MEDLNGEWMIITRKRWANKDSKRRDHQSPNNRENREKQGVTSFNTTTQTK